MPLLMCPSCNGSMKELNRSGVLIDMCTECKGVWLDRGELEKLLTIASEDVQEAMEIKQPPQPQYQGHPHYAPPPQHGYHPADYKHSGRYRKKSKLESILNIFD